MVPYGVQGTIEEIKSGSFTVEETVAKVRTENNELVDICMMQKWPVRIGRPYREKLPPTLHLLQVKGYRHSIPFGQRWSCGRTRTFRKR